MKKERAHNITNALRIGAFSLIAAFCLVLSPRPAAALPICDTCCALVSAIHEVTREAIREEHRHLREEVFGKSAGILDFPERPDPPEGFWRLQHHELWLIETYFGTNNREPGNDYILPALMMMAEQLVTIMMEQMLIVGTFFDAKEILETAGLFQKLAAEAHKDYHPSFQMCEFGSNTRSLADADFQTDMTILTLNKKFMDRQLGQKGSVGGGGPSVDRASGATDVSPTDKNRLGFFLRKACDRKDVNRMMHADDPTGLFICTIQTPIDEGWVNRDIDWNNTVMSPRTINLDFEEDVSDNARIFEMSNYLYGHEIFTRPSAALLEREQNQDNFLDSRSVIAKRSVAQHSFNSIVGLKSRGGIDGDYNSTDTAAALRYIMVELGFPEDDFIPYNRYLYHKNEEKDEAGIKEDEHPISYYAQMEFLAKKMYQRPEFYTNLYDKPANVERISATLQAIKTMLDRDIFDSQLRAEAIMSMILEIRVVQEQQYIQDRFGLVRERSRQ